MLRSCDRCIQQMFRCDDYALRQELLHGYLHAIAPGMCQVFLPKIRSPTDRRGLSKPRRSSGWKHKCRRGTNGSSSSLWCPMKPRTVNRLNRSPLSVLRLAGGLGIATLALCASPALSASPMFGDISLNVRIEEGPPPPRHEVIVERDRPGPDFVWTEGYWDGAPGHYVWVGGHWNRPPHPHTRWFAPHWEKDHDGHFHQIKGEWR